MRNISFAIFILIFHLVLTGSFLDGGKGIVYADNYETTSFDSGEKMSQIIKNQKKIERELKDIKEELRIIKIRVTNRNR